MSKAKEEAVNRYREPTLEEVKDWLKTHPDFLFENPDVLEILVPPDKFKDDHVWDFQHFAIRRLQDQVRQTRQKFDGLILSARENTSVQMQVSKAIVGLVKARNLEQLLEVVTLDLVNLFGVDVVRLAMESEAAELYDCFYPEHQYSGIVFIDPGITEEMFGKKLNVRLSADTSVDDIPGFDQIFTECTKLVKSCAFLKLTLKDTSRDAILAFGVREVARFHPEQGSDLLRFLAQVLEERLEVCLKDTGLDQEP